MAKTLLINDKELKHASNISWSDDITTTSDTMDFESDIQIDVGSQFALYDGSNLVMAGIIQDYSQSKKNRFAYACSDFGFYLNQNSIKKQFNNANIADAYKALLKEYAIPYGAIPDFKATIKEDYKNTPLADVLKDMLSIAQSKLNVDYYYFDCSKGVFEIKKYAYKDDLLGFMTEVYSAKGDKTLYNPSLTVSMQDLRNKILVVDSATEKTKKQIIAKDDTSIIKYGLLQHIEEVDTNNKNDFATIAKNKLAELNKIKTTFSASMLGDYKMCKGVVLPIKNDDFDIDGDFLITSSKHSIKQGVEFVDLTLQKYDKNKII